MIKKILDLSNEIEALRIQDILEGSGIRYFIKSFHDSAYDGLFQAQYGWGVLQADEEDEARILELLKEAGDANDIEEPTDSPEL